MSRAVSYSTTNKNQGKGRRKGNVNVAMTTTDLTSSLDWYAPPALTYDQRLIISDTSEPTAGENVTPMFLVCDDDSEVIRFENQHKVKIDGYPTIYLVKGEQVVEYDAKVEKKTLTEFLNTVL